MADFTVGRQPTDGNLWHNPVIGRIKGQPSRHSERHMNNNPSDFAQGALNFRTRSNTAKNPDSIARDLVHLAAELFGYVGNYSAERDRAMKLAKKAIEGLRVANDRIRIAESERRAVEAENGELSDRVEKVSAKLQEAKIIIEQMATRMLAAEARLSAAEQRANAAEVRANKAEYTIRRIGTLGLLGWRGRRENVAALASA
jgi:hypothetical protein